LLSVIRDSFQEKNLSVTLDRNRVNSTKRLEPLGDIELNPLDYQRSFAVKFYKAVLLINGLKTPIVFTKD